MPGRGRNQRNKTNQYSKGTSQYGVCICPQCNYSVIHKRGVPCFTLICPKCNIPLIRQVQSESLNNQQVSNKNTKTSIFPKIDPKLCVGCGACVKICPVDAILLEDGKARITTEKCKNCRVCVNVCKVNAIT